MRIDLETSETYIVGRSAHKNNNNRKKEAFKHTVLFSVTPQAILWHLLSSVRQVSPSVFILCVHRLQLNMESSAEAAATDFSARTFSQVVFTDIPHSYPPSTSVTCCYTLTPAFQPNPRDWVGIFKVRKQQIVAGGLKNL